MSEKDIYDDEDYSGYDAIDDDYSKVISVVIMMIII